MNLPKLNQALAVFIIAFVAGGCASVSRQRTPVTAEQQPVGQRLVHIAATLIGTPYKFGGDTPQGFDCSGLVFYSFDQLGVEVPRTAEDQRRAAQGVKPEALSPGDLVFFRTTTRKVDHVGIYAGDGRFIHAPRSGSVVSYAYLDDPYYRAHFVGAGRLQ